MYLVFVIILSKLIIRISQNLVPVPPHNYQVRINQRCLNSIAGQDGCSTQANEEPAAEGEEESCEA